MVWLVATATFLLKFLEYVGRRVIYFVQICHFIRKRILLLVHEEAVYLKVQCFMSVLGIT